MSCPTCSHTMAKMVIDDESHWFHCERCGTLLCLVRETKQVYVPKLVDRCRSFGEQLGPLHAKIYERHGITESIYRPEERP